MQNVVSVELLIKKRLDVEQDKIISLARAWLTRGPQAALDGLSCGPRPYMTNIYFSGISIYILNRIKVIKRNKVPYNYMKNNILINNM